PKDELIAKEKQELEAKVNVESLEPLKTQVFQLKFAKAADVVPRLGGGQGAAPAAGGQASASTSTGLLSTRGSVAADPRTNQLFVTDIPSRLVAVQALLERIDVGVQQVVIEARIVEANDSFGRSLGVRLGGADLRGVNKGDAGYGVGGGNRVTFGGSYGAAANSTGFFGADASSAFSNFVNLPITPPPGTAESAVASLALTLFNPMANRLLSLEIQAMEAEGKGTIVSSPRLMTANQVTAIIEQGKEIPYTVQNANGPPTTNYKKAVLKLEVTPQITPDGKIILDLQINKDSQGTPTPKGDVIIDTKAIKTQAIVENGGTVMLGGIFEAIENNSETKVPLLGDLPYVGNLFKSRFKDTSRKEMLVFITPRVLDK
ncbi:MAG: type IV pilus secretin PilQ, partial [Burkholderiales bacterium]|nr:type IV pilus secretin PilQ [Burkholderiales bacterium]